MKHLVSVILLSIVFIGCGGGGGGSAPVDTSGGATPTSSIDAKYYGAWKYADSGTEEYITSKTTLSITPVNDDLLQVTENGTTRHLIRDGLRYVNISGSVDSIDSSVSRSLRAGNIGGMNVILSNIKDDKIKSTPTVGTDGKFSDNTLPAGTYDITGSKDGLSFSSQVEISEEDTDLGAFVAVDETLHNFKAELIMDDEFIYADGNTYNGKIRVKNISQVDGIGLNYTITLTDENLKAFSHDNIVGSVLAGSYKDIPIHVSFNNFLFNQKDITINMLIKDVNNNEWNEKLIFKAYRDKFRLNLASEHANIRGYVTLPNKKQKMIALSSGYVDLPTMYGDNYYIVLSNPDISQETSYSIGYETSTADLSAFSNTSAYESENGSMSGAIKIDKGTNISSYLHVGDIDFYKLEMNDGIRLFDSEFNANLNSVYYSNEVLVTNLLLQDGTQITVNNGNIILNNINVGQSHSISLNDKIKIELESAHNFNQANTSIIKLGELHTSYSVVTKEDLEVSNLNNEIIKNAAISTAYISKDINISNINNRVEISIDNGQIIKNGVGINANSTTVINGDIINIKLLSSYNFDDDIVSNVTIGKSKFYIKIITADIVTINNANDTISYWADKQYELTDLINWDNATNYCNNLDYGGFTDWRLPTKSELQTIRTMSGDGIIHIDYSLKYGFNELTDYRLKRFWTSEQGTVPNYYWTVPFNNDSISTYHKTQVNLVRCIRTN